MLSQLPLIAQGLTVWKVSVLSYSLTYSQVGLYILYALRFQIEYSSGPVIPLSFVISSLGLLIFPLITFLLAFWSLRAKDVTYSFVYPIYWIIFDSILSFYLLNFFLWVCWG